MHPWSSRCPAKSLFSRPFTLKKKFLPLTTVPVPSPLISQHLCLSFSVRDTQSYLWLFKTSRSCLSPQGLHCSLLLEEYPCLWDANSLNSPPGGSPIEDARATPRILPVTELGLALRYLLVYGLQPSPGWVQKGTCLPFLSLFPLLRTRCLKYS